MEQINDALPLISTVRFNGLVDFSTYWIKPQIQIIDDFF